VSALKKQQEMAVAEKIQKDVANRRPVINAGILYKQEALNRITEQIKQDKV
jgi:hypothetical protein